MPRRHPLLFPIVAAAASAVLSFTPATTRAQVRDGRAAFRVAIREELPAERAVRFALVGDELVVGSELEVTRGVRAVTLTGLPGRAQLVLQARAGRAGIGTYIQLTHVTPPGRDGNTHTTISARGGRVQIRRTARGAGEDCSVSLVQNPPGLAAVGGGLVVERRDPAVQRVLFQVRHVRNGARVPAADLRLSAESVGALLREHPVETERYLAPILRDFGQEAALFRVDPGMAWQVLADEIAPPDESVEAHVRALVAELDAEAFRTRDAASKRLQSLGGPAARVLMELPPDGLSPEQNTRIEAIVTAYRRLPPDEAQRLGSDVNFLLRCFCHADDPDLRAAAALRLKEQLGEAASTLDPAAAKDARLAAAQQLRDDGAIEPPVSAQ